MTQEGKGIKNMITTTSKVALGAAGTVSAALLAMYGLDKALDPRSALHVPAVGKTIWPAVHRIRGKG